jgi:hypothetical protein
VMAKRYREAWRAPRIIRNPIAEPRRSRGHRLGITPVLERRFLN